MNEAQVNGTETGDVINDEALVDETMAGGNGGVDAETLRQDRLVEFLRELVQEEARTKAAELLGVFANTHWEPSSG